MGRQRTWLQLVLLVPGLLGVGLVCGAAQELPIVDAHIHYSQPDWQVLSPAQALAILAQAGVRRAIVSSTPDDGTLQLYEQAPQRIIPFLRPYRTRQDMATWHSDAAVQAYVEERIQRGSTRASASFTCRRRMPRRRW